MVHLADIHFISQTYIIWMLILYAHLQSLQTGPRKSNLFLICSCLPLRLLNDSHRDSIHTIVWTTSETRISLCWLHNFHALITKGHLFGPLVSQSFPCWGLRGGVALWTVAADNPTLCELVLLHKGLIVESNGPGRGDWVYARWQRGVGSGGLGLGARAAVAGPK